MSRPGIENVRQLGDLVSLYRWNVSIVAPAAISGFITSSDFNIRCESTDLPSTTINEVSTTIRGHTVMSPGIMKYSNKQQLSFVETTDMMIHRFFQTWREAIWATGSGISSAPKRDLQTTVILTQLDNQDNEVWSYNLIGAWLSSYDMGKLDSASTDFQKPSCSLTYDYFTEQAVNAST